MSADIYFPDRPNELNNLLTNHIRRRKARKGTERWYQHVHHKRSSNSYIPSSRYFWRSKPRITPRLSQKHPIIQDCIAYFKQYKEIKNNSSIKRKENNIPIWICNRCTYNNIERGSYCKICHQQYSKSNVLYNEGAFIKNDTRNNIKEICLIDYMKPDIIDKLSSNAEINDMELQIAIESSLKYENHENVALSSRKTIRNRGKRRKSRQKKLKKLREIEKMEKDEQDYRQVYIANKQNHINIINKKNNDENIKMAPVKPKNCLNETTDPGNYIAFSLFKDELPSIKMTITMKPISKYQYVAPAISMNPEMINKKDQTYSVDNPVKLKNFELLECNIILFNEFEEKIIKSFKMKSDDENNKHIYFPLYLCEHPWIDLSKTSINSKLFEICRKCLKQCIPNLYTKYIDFEYDSIHDPIYNLLPMSCDIARILVEFIPSYDVVQNVLMQFIGHKEICYISMNVDYLSYGYPLNIDHPNSQIIAIDHEKYQHKYTPFDLWDKNDNDIQDEDNQELEHVSSSYRGPGLFGDDSSSEDSSSSDDDYPLYNLGEYRPRTSYTQNVIRYKQRRSWYTPCLQSPEYSTPHEIFSFDGYCRPERVAKISKYPLKYIKIRSPNRILQNKWSAYHKLDIKL